MKEIDNLITFLGLDASPQVETYKKLAIYRKLKKHELLCGSEERSKYVYFLISGVVRGFIIDENGSDITDCFLFRYGQSHVGYLESGESLLVESAEAVVDTEVICFERSKVIPYVQSTLEVSALYNRKLTECFAEQWLHKNILHRSTAMVRYQWFLQAYPGLIDVVPHKNIASFLDMTPVTLSRLRRIEKDEKKGK